MRRAAVVDVSLHRLCPQMSSTLTKHELAPRRKTIRYYQMLLQSVSTKYRMRIKKVSRLMLDNMSSTIPRENEGTEREAPSPGLGICQFH